MPRSPSPLRLARLSASLVAAAAGCQCGTTALKVQDRTTVVIRTPADGSGGDLGTAVTFFAPAENPAGLAKLVLQSPATRSSPPAPTATAATPARSTRAASRGPAARPRRSAARGQQPAQRLRQRHPDLHDATKGCVKGYLCTSSVSRPELGQACNAQCNDPVDPSSYGLFGSPPQSRDCPRGLFCDRLIGTGNQVVLTGICQPIF